MPTLSSTAANTVLSPPATDATRVPVRAPGLKERMLVRASLMNHDAQLRNFTPMRDRLVASGEDPNAKYREIQSARDRLAAEWKNLGPTASPLLSPALPGTSATSLPIAVPRVLGGPGLAPWLGYSGTVRMPPAQELENQWPDPYGVSGVIGTLTDGLLPNAGVLFTADLRTRAKAELWLHTWQYLILFPRPVVQSVLTYSFGMGVQVDLMGGFGSATFLSFLSLGETPNLTLEGITVHHDGFPLITNFDHAPPEAGGLNVTRSFHVGAGELPAVGVVVGVAAGLSEYSEIYLSPGADNFICLAEAIDPATGIGPVNTRGLVNFHYQPLPIATQA